MALDDRLMAVPVTLEPSFQAGAPAPLFKIVHGIEGPFYDVTADGQKFLVPTAPESAGSPPLSMVVNWTALTAKPEPSR